MFDRSAAAVLDGDARTCWQLPIASAEDLAPAFEQLLSHRLAATYDPPMVWWTEGSSIVEPSCLIARGLPAPDTFAALLDGSWQQHRWRPVPAQIAMSRAAADLPVAEPALNLRSAAASDVGRVRQVNQDAFLERAEVGLWVVADGLGGHSDGEHASRMVCDAFADFAPGSSFDDTIEAARGRLQDVNDQLLLPSSRSLLADRSGSTVVALFVRGQRVAVLWAGDSRVYRCREGRLEQLTRDHSPSESGSLAGLMDSHAVTRAVGAQSTLMLDLHRDQLQPGDRFLLCSDGLTRAVPTAQIKVWLENAGHPDGRGRPDQSDPGRRCARQRDRRHRGGACGCALADVDPYEGRFGHWPDPRSGEGGVLDFPAETGKMRPPAASARRSGSRSGRRLLRQGSTKSGSGTRKGDRTKDGGALDPRRLPRH